MILRTNSTGLSFKKAWHVLEQQLELDVYDESKTFDWCRAKTTLKDYGTYRQLWALADDGEERDLLRSGAREKRLRKMKKTWPDERQEH